MLSFRIKRLHFEMGCSICIAQTCNCIFNLLIANVTAPDSSPHVLDKSALYGSSQEFLLRALQPAAAKPAAKKTRAAGGGEESGTRVVTHERSHSTLIGFSLQKPHSDSLQHKTSKTNCCRPGRKRVFPINIGISHRDEERMQKSSIVLTGGVTPGLPRWRTAASVVIRSPFRS